ncbi:DUF934 domain-containing protein [Rhodobacter ferrooxidans]|uniref:Oxidoreductase probably involved in sulfite reduction n=1 Tax=Rhodobacter ferrooxidans TaxID=371731 RepID=C8RZD7_9RHOB|nr:DUF934 domain-containing protein [Rhodobacter sp. SW2]EEW25734.1 conserved hypothetical protein [Rhodobacter sp. SW2]
MSILVTDQGFSTPAPADTVAFADRARHRGALDLANTDDPDALADILDDLTLIRVAFPAFHDGRGFTIARRLRHLGYLGQLHAQGHVLADQYAMARRTGFDAVEISDDLAARQPEADWLARADWQANDYQSLLRG